VNGRSQSYDDNGHGTFVAGVAAGSGARSRGLYRGVAPEAGIFAIKSMDAQGNGTAVNVLSALQWVADHHRRLRIRVVSLSLGAPMFGAYRDDAMVHAAEQLWDRGVTVVAAAGNEGPGRGTITVPGVSGRIITVGALDDHRTPDRQDDHIPSFSSRGPAYRRIKPDVVAPGVDIVSTAAGATGQGSSYTTMTGTSVAAPMVAGMAALLLQMHPEWTPAQVKRHLMLHAQPLRGDLLSEGRGMATLAAP